MKFLLTQTNLQLYNAYKEFDQKPDRDSHSLKNWEPPWKGRFHKPFQFCQPTFEQQLSKIILLVTMKFNMLKQDRWKSKTAQRTG